MGFFEASLGFLGGVLGSNKEANTEKDITREQLLSSKEYAQNGIQWRVEDAKKAGIHPLAAMGLPLASAPTLSVGNSSFTDAYASMGQNIGRAVDSTLTRDERAASEVADSLKLEHMSLQNDLLRAQITNVNHASNPAVPSNSDMPLLIGQGNGFSTSGQLLPPPTYVSETPLQRVHSAPGRPSQEVGAVSDVGFARTPTGYAPIPSQDVKNRIEDQIIPEVMWAIRNNVMPSIGQGEKPSASLLPKWAIDWRWNLFKQEWEPVSKYGIGK